MSSNMCDTKYPKDEITYLYYHVDKNKTKRYYPTDEKGLYYEKDNKKIYFLKDNQGYYFTIDNNKIYFLKEPIKKININIENTNIS